MKMFYLNKYTKMTKITRLVVTNHFSVVIFFCAERNLLINKKQSIQYLEYSVFAYTDDSVISIGRCTVSEGASWSFSRAGWSLERTIREPGIGLFDWKFPADDSPFGIRRVHMTLMRKCDNCSYAFECAPRHNRRSSAKLFEGHRSLHSWPFSLHCDSSPILSQKILVIEFCVFLGISRTSQTGLM